jgi:hypothetical protein
MVPPLQVAWQFTKQKVAMCGLMDLQALGFAMLQYVQGQFDVEASYLKQLSTATNYAEVEAIDIMQGWFS